MQLKRVLVLCCTRNNKRICTVLSARVFQYEILKKKECVVKTHDRSETFVLQENQNIVNYH
jgi:hypothetical protein